MKNKEAINCRHNNIFAFKKAVKVGSNTPDHTFDNNLNRFISLYYA
jgi:hypothetical protein